jgi:hypothetical protein
VSTNAFSQLLSREQAIRFDNRLARMDPLWLDRVEPRALGGQEEGQDANAFPCLFDLLVVLANPPATHFAEMPAGIIPDHQPVALALGSQTLTTLLQKRYRDHTDRASGDQAQPDCERSGSSGGPFCHRTPEQASALGSGSSFCQRWSIKRSGCSALCQACMCGWAKRLHQTSSKKPMAQSGRGLAEALKRSRAFF